MQKYFARPPERRSNLPDSDLTQLDRAMASERSMR